MPRRSAPAHLRKATAAWWRSVVREFSLDEHHERLLTLAAEAYDRAEEAREVLAAEGSYLSDRFGQLKAQPGGGC